jgi:hypothetical protein
MKTEVLEDKSAWAENFRRNWLAKLEQQGVADWKVYEPPRNQHAPGTPGINLQKSSLLMVTSAGAYLRGQQQAFDEANPYGDYTLRTFPAATPLSALAYAHGHYDPSMIRKDAQAGIPLRHLEAMVAAGRLGGLAPDVVSMMGYQPDAARVVDEVIPQVIASASEQAVQAAMLAPV